MAQTGEDQIKESLKSISESINSLVGNLKTFGKEISSIFDDVGDNSEKVEKEISKLEKHLGHLLTKETISNLNAYNKNVAKLKDEYKDINNILNNPKMKAMLSQKEIDKLQKRREEIYREGDTSDQIKDIYGYEEFNKKMFSNLSKSFPNVSNFFEGFSKGYKDSIMKGQSKKDSFGVGLSAGLSNQLLNIFANLSGKILEKFTSSIKKFITDIKSEVKKMISEVASYSLSTSLITNSTARTQALTYGLSDAQNYAFTQAKSLLGITSDEDLYYMNENQRQMFSELMEKYTSMYEEMNSNGQLEAYQEMQIELAELKSEFSSSIVSFLAENKDLIVSFMEIGLDTLEGIFTIMDTVLGWVKSIRNWLGTSEDDEDILNDYLQTQTTVNNGGSTTSNSYNVTANAYGVENNPNDYANAIANGIMSASETWSNS